jgi:hypothetical protein
VLRGSPKLVPEAPKTSGKWGGKGSKASSTSTEESTPESASSKLVKKFFISTPGNNSLRQDDYKVLFVEHKAMYGNCFCFGIVDKRSVDILKVVREAPIEIRVCSLEQRGTDNVYNRLSTSPVIQKKTLCFMPKDVYSMPKSWDEIKDCEFYAINGQYTAAATRRMIEDPLCTRKDEVRY